ncbi:hypothetical protein J7L36_00225, partial [bacterium]|nr:hypothetical protein [bacterium]
VWPLGELVEGAQIEERSLKTRVEQVEKKVRKVKQALETPPGVPVITEDTTPEEIIEIINEAEDELEEEKILLVVLETALRKEQADRLKEQANRLREKIQRNEKRILELEREIEMVQEELSLIDKDKNKEQKEALEVEIEEMEREIQELKKPQEKLEDLKKQIKRLPESSIMVSKKVKEMDDKGIQKLIEEIRELQQEIEEIKRAFFSVIEKLEEHLEKRLEEPEEILSTWELEELEEDEILKVFYRAAIETRRTWLRWKMETPLHEARTGLQRVLQAKVRLEEDCQYLFGTILFGKEELNKEEQELMEELLQLCIEEQKEQKEIQKLKKGARSR